MSRHSQVRERGIRGAINGIGSEEGRPDPALALAQVMKPQLFSPTLCHRRAAFLLLHNGLIAHPLCLKRRAFFNTVVRFLAPHPGPLPNGQGDAERAARDFHGNQPHA